VTTDTTRPRRPGAVVLQRPGRPQMVVYVFGRFVRIVHWVRNFLLIWLVLSGLYIGNPFLARNLFTETANNFMMAQIRGWHVAAGWLLLAFTLARIYQFLFVRADGRLGLGRELRMVPILFNWKAWRDQLSFYFFFRRQHPHYTYSNYGPLQFLTYTALYATLLIISVTGILLAAPYVHGGLASFGAELLRPIEVWMGGLSNVRGVHRFTMMWFVVFFVIHLYMAVWNSLRSGTMMIDSMISGFQSNDVDTRPAEVEDLASPRKDGRG
jgi:Ni/Fe-hydrogenase 1 B-type cytochrome subunit